MSFLMWQEYEEKGEDESVLVQNWLSFHKTLLAPKF